MLISNDVTDFRERKYDNMKGVQVKGIEKIPPSMYSDARRLPTCIVIDTSGSMEEYSNLLHTAAVNLIEQLAKDDTALAKIDLEIITFNTKDQINIRIPAQELEELIDENGRLKEEYKLALNFECGGGTPTGYALHVAVNELLDRYKVLKGAGKSPFSPIMFFMSDGYPEVASINKVEHDNLLNETLKEIRKQVNEKRLSVIAVEAGQVCELKKSKNEEDKRNYNYMHKLMRDITGLSDDHHIRQAVNEQDIKTFFTFTETLLKESSTGNHQNIDELLH